MGRGVETCVGYEGRNYSETGNIPTLLLGLACRRIESAKALVDPLPLVPVI